jgi:hypothetical protein
VSLEGCSETFDTLSGIQRSIKPNSVALTTVLLSISDDFCIPADSDMVNFCV